MFIAQCSLKSRQRADAVQWSSPKAENGEVHREQTTEEGSMFSFGKGQ